MHDCVARLYKLCPRSDFAAWLCAGMLLPAKHTGLWDRHTSSAVSVSRPSMTWMLLEYRNMRLRLAQRSRPLMRSSAVSATHRSSRSGQASSPTRLVTLSCSVQLSTTAAIVNQHASSNKATEQAKFYP